MGQVFVRRITGLFVLMALLLCGPGVVVAQDAAHSVTDVAHTVGAHADDHGDHAHGDDAHGHGGHHKAHAPELPSMFHVLKSIKTSDGHTLGDNETLYKISRFERQIYLFIVIGLAILFMYGMKLAISRPGKVQAAAEMLAEGLTTFFTGIVGKEHKRHVPFLCSLFLFIWINNLSSLVPGFAPSTGIYPTTIALALMVFFYFIGFGIYEGGLGHFLWHLAGSPKDALGWIISPALFVLEVVGTLAKPLSLSLRLFGNIMGEDILLGVFLLLGIMVAGAFTPDPVIGVPLHIPFMFLVLLGSTIQALVFSLLSAIYLAMVLPHHDHEHDEHHGEDHHPLLPGAEEKNENSGHVDAGVVPFA